MSVDTVAQAPEIPTESAETRAWERPTQGIKWLLVITGVVGLLAACQLLIEKLRLLADPDYIPSCSLNPILSCGTVMNSPQASAFGFPNIMLGIAAFAMIVAIGMGLFAGAAYRRWYWIGLQLGTIFGICFVTWLQYQSLYSIQKLCLYCIAVWMAMIPLFVGVTFYNLKTGVLGTSPSAQKTWAKVSHYAWAIVLVWYAIIFAAIILKFPNVLSF